MSEASFVPNPAWQLLLSEQRVYLSGGADEVYLIDEVPHGQAAERLLRAWNARALSELAEDAELSAAYRQLTRIGALVPTQRIKTSLKAALCWAGDAMSGLDDAVRAHVAARADKSAELTIVDDERDAQLAIVVRSNASWQETLATYRRAMPRVPHLFVDLSYAHTIAIGPFVVVGQTACVACLGNRIAHQWGDAPVPTRPGVHDQRTMVGAIVGNAALEFARDGVCASFVERAVALDVRSLLTRVERVFRLPECPVCHTSFATGSGASGKLPLPWATAARASKTLHPSPSPSPSL